MEHKQPSNLKITLHLESPVLLGHPYIHFDGIITHIRLREKMGNDYYTDLPSKQPRDITDIAMGRDTQPLEAFRSFHNRHAGLKIFHASTSVFDSEFIAATTLYKKFDTNHTDVLDSRKTIYSDRGLFKSYMMKMLYNPSHKCRFYARGDYDAIKYLLSYLPGLGKKVDVGFGAISKIEVEKIDRDKSIFDGKKVMRPIPIELLENWSESYPSVFMPPYWNRANTRMCAPPFAEATPKPELATHLSS